MQVHPFVHLGNDLRRGFAAHHTVEHTDCTLVFAVGEVYVRRIMVALVEADDDSPKIANFRHNIFRYIVLWVQRYEKSAKLVAVSRKM